jgi:hypothetical protein
MPNVFNGLFLSSTRFAFMASDFRSSIMRFSLDAHCRILKPPRANNAIISSRSARASSILSVPVSRSSTYKCVLRTSAAAGYA